MVFFALFYFVFFYFAFLSNNLVFASTWCLEAQAKNQGCIIVLQICRDTKDIADLDMKSLGGLVSTRSQLH